ncbi:MAG TPA: ATP-binding SpoIIE family protein phosphatase [Candidatus Baltobacteraceae bacterium]|nr:ATP-binding SpoIIE family protein phosphatase [Candidatus Baltobacteraceae bacterium]
MRPRIRTQAYLVGALPLAFLIALLVLGLVMQSRIQAGASLSSHTQQVLEHVDRIRAFAGDGNRAATTAPIAQAGADLAKARSQAESTLAQTRGMVRDDPGVPQALSSLSRVTGDIFDLLQHYVQLKQAHRIAEARALGTAPSTRALAGRFDKVNNAFTDSVRRAELAHLAQLREQTKNIEIAIVAASLAGIILTLLVAGRFGLRLARRLGHLAENARRLARGEPATPLLGDDEFSDLDLVYQAMMRQIVRQQQVNETLQRMLLPQELPSCEGIRLDTAYVPASRETEVGGDWYDAFPISDRCVCISIGDVAGHGMRAAAVMGAARIAVRTAARMHDDPAAIMEHLNRVISADEPGTMVTAVVAMLDTDDGTLRYAVAGHPEPMIIRADGETDLLGGRGVMLGADDRTQYQTFRTALHEGWALLLYTDGLVEITRDYFKGVEELREAASEEFASSSQNIAEAIQRRTLRGRACADDAALLFVGVTRLGLSAADRTWRSWTLDACDSESAHRAKRAILWHVGDTIRDGDRIASIELVLGELIGNVARHSPGLAEVTLSQEGSRMLIRVTDRGKPFSYHLNGAHADPFAESGRGLFLVSTLSTDVRIEHTDTGNVVTAVLN